MYSWRDKKKTKINTHTHTKEVLLASDTSLLVERYALLANGEIQ